MRAQAAAADGQSQAAQIEDGENSKKVEEEKKEEDGVMSIDAIVAAQIATKPWSDTIEEFSTNAKKFNKRKCLLKMLSELEGRDKPYEDILEFFNGEKEILFAVLVQNLLHPKNSQRTDAIKDGKYVEIETVEQAQNFLSSLLRTHLTNKLRAAESSVLSALTSMQASADIEKLVKSPDVYIAACALGDQAFYQGQGNRSTFFDIILKLNPMQIPDLGNKLALIT